MLKYSIKLSGNDIKQEAVDWGEKYLSPDLSFVSGVTSQDYHLEKFKNIAVSNSISHTSNIVLPIETKNVTREGFIVIKGKKYDVEYVGDGTRCVFLNGKYYYEKDGIFFIDNWLKKADDSLEVREELCSASTSSITSDGKLPIDTVVWVEDGTVTIDDETYIFDLSLNGIRRIGKTDLMEASDITECDGIDCNQYEKQSDYQHVTKFKLTKGEEISELFENVSFIKYFYYILYKDEYLSIFKDEDDYFVCEVPNTLLGTSSSGVTRLSAYTDVIDDNGGITSVKVSGDSFDVLRTNLCYITIDNNRFEVQNDILNANDGSEIGIYLDNDTYNISIGDTVYFIDSKDYVPSYNVYSDANKQFVLFKSERYNVIPNLCDKAQIGDDEYEIEYINGRHNSAECIVHIDDTNLSMAISGDNLEQKGLVVMLDGTNSKADKAIYKINEYSGITIDGSKYPIDVISGEASVNIDLPNEYKFTVTDIKGSSLLICKPYLSNSDFSDSFIQNISSEFCTNVVSNQESLSLRVNNNIFGKREITKELAYNAYSGSTSSDDYFNLFDNLTLYVPNAYIHIPLALNAPNGNNLLQDDLIKRDFYEYQRKKAINPIIDMEKDVYYPEYFEGVYCGSETIFKDINEIRFNLHFRTRNLESWKVNEDYNNAEASGTCNWFITDISPYKGMLSSDKASLLNSSDIVGLLGFTNDDVYYQKSNISKSFLRLSFYDSIDQQNQTLLATSTVFMDGRKIFKKFIDNSRKGLFNQKFQEVESGMKLNKISTKSEFIDQLRVVIDDNHRLGSEFIVNNKYEANSSSEGYYLYMFKEYSEKLRPKSIYMKIEFNHAGYGRTIPFIIPMAWKDEDNSGNKTPVSALTLDNLEELKRGVNLEDSYAQSYIPLYAVYDFKRKRYAYVFDRRYINVDENENLIFNLFEIKFTNEVERDENKIKEEQKEIAYKKLPTAKINYNKNMFGDI